MTQSVYINRIAKYLPGEPVGNEEMEDYLGLVNMKKSRSKAITLRHNKITNRFYANDKQGKSLYSNAELTAEAIKKLTFDGFSIQDIELLTSGTTSPDQMLPAHGVMVHGLLENARSIETISFSGGCCASMNALKYAYMSILTGNTSNAVTTGSEKLGTILSSSKFEEEVSKLKEVENNPIIALEKDFLRWMLSDGAAAALLSDKPNPNGISLRIEWIEISSFANESDTCMYMGADKDENGNFQGWSVHKPKEWLDKSVFSLKQDTRILEKNITRLGGIKYQQVLEKRKLHPNDVDYFLPHISSEYFREKLFDEMKKLNLEIPQERWFTNLTHVGNIGSASIFIALEELLSSGKLKKGEKLLLSVPESARFSYAYALLTVC
jgi:3-oxoacyl-[acyl-carrier-protein] synthase III